MQQDLFSDVVDNTPAVLPMQDAEVTYFPKFLDSQSADVHFTRLIGSLAWQHEYLRIYGKRVKIPRLQAWYGDPEATYQYSGLNMLPRPWTKELDELKILCQKACNSNFNSVLANLYRNGLDSMGLHADNEAELGNNPVIASISLGQTRDFNFIHNISKEKIRITLGHGSLLIMSGATQKNWQHSIAKSRQAMSPRINLTFRRIIGERQL
ncbi:MAG: alkylated DNA repair dioxygenase AlkB [Paraglaciecola sp.]|jgi:alkylated DNA repair dioxygenase AlkB